MAWVTLAGVEGITTTTKIDTDVFDDKNYLNSQFWYKGTSGTDTRFNSDSDAEYNHRVSYNGSADATSVNLTSFVDNFGFSNEVHFGTMTIFNVGTNTKLGILEFGVIGSTGAGNAPNRAEFVYKFVETDQITSFQCDAQTGTYSDGGIMVIGND